MIPLKHVIFLGLTKPRSQKYLKKKCKKYHSASLPFNSVSINNTCQVYVCYICLSHSYLQRGVSVCFYFRCVETEQSITTSCFSSCNQPAFLYPDLAPPLCQIIATDTLVLRIKPIDIIQTFFRVLTCCDFPCRLLPTLLSSPAPDSLTCCLRLLHRALLWIQPDIPDQTCLGDNKLVKLHPSASLVCPHLG